MPYGDVLLGATVRFKFTTKALSVPLNMEDSPVLAAYVDDSTTPITAGVTLTQPFDGIDGLAHVEVVATAGNGFAAATDVSLVLVAGTLGGMPMAGTVVEEFSIENRSMTADDPEPPQEAPPATISARRSMRYLFKAWRNRSTQTAAAYKLFADDATTVDQKSATSSDGVTYDSGEKGSGP